MALDHRPGESLARLVSVRSLAMKMMIRMLAGVAVALPLFALVGCGDEAMEAVTPSPTEAAAVKPGDSDLATTHQGLVTGQRVHLRAAHSLKCLDVDGASPYNGARVNQWDCWGGANQTFTATVQPNGAWVFTALHSGKCLEIAGYSYSNGAPLQQNDCSGGYNQQFWVLYSGGAYAIEPVHTAKCLDVAGYSLSNGAAVDQWDCSFNLNQLFYIEDAG
jgi:hypothetical protein